MIFKVGLTGGIGSGKTTVAKIFENLGVPVFNADTAGKTLMVQDEKIKQQVIELFGPQAYQDNRLQTAYIAGIVFQDKEKLAALNQLIHPATIRAAQDWMQLQTTPYAIKEAALIFEAGAEKELDAVIGVTAPLALRLERIMHRDQISQAQATARMKNQLAEEEKMKRCDYVIYNDEQNLLIPQVLSVHASLLQRAKT